MNLRITGIQRFSLHDGPGIRTTIFTKGCGIRCPWCSNPENLSYEIQTGKGGNVYGTDMDTKKLLEICLKDKEYYIPMGGVTVSGGEALLQADAIAELFERLKEYDIGRCIETALFAPVGGVEKLAKITELFYVDMKIMDKLVAKDILGADIELYHENLERLFSLVDRDRITVRVPLVRGMSFTRSNIEAIIEKVSELKPAGCEIFSVHNLGKSKYEDLGIEYKDFDAITAEELMEVKKEFEKECKDTDISILSI